MVPAYNATFSKPLLNQIIALIQRDQAAAIAIVNPALAPIAEFHKGPGTRMAFPWLTVAVNDTRFDAEADPQTRHQFINVSLALDVGQFDQEMAQDNAQDYARVLDMVLTSAAPEDAAAALPITHETVPRGVTSPPAAGTVQRVFIQAHRYSAVEQAEVPTPILRVTLDVLFELEET